MKIRPIILCGGEGTRLWQKSTNNEPKQFINFGGWNLFEKTLKRIKGPLFDYPIISTNVKYLKKISDTEIVNLNIPTGQPLVFELNDQLCVKNDYFLKDLKEQ